MSSAQVNSVVRYLRRLARAERDGQVSDSQLLERFTTRRDEAAFAILVRRHGPMVFHVCRSVLRHQHGSEDALQAVFLVLARKAASIRHRDSIAGWLHEVAYRAAIKAQADAARRPLGQARACEMAAADPSLDLSVRDLKRVLHEELRRLPDKYRLPLVLCYLEENSHDEAARQLGWTKGTLRGRLDRGREQLRRRLQQREVSLSAALCAVGLSLKTSTAIARLVDPVVRASVHYLVDPAGSGFVSARAAMLAKGVSKMLFISKMKFAAVLVLGISLLTASTGALTLAPIEPPQHEQAAARSEEQTQESQSPAKAKNPPKEEKDPPAVVLDPDDPLDMALLRWQKAIDKIETASCSVSRTDRNNTLKHVDVFEGTFKYKKPRRFVLELRRKDKPELFEKWIRDGMLLHQYAPDTKEILEHDLRSDALIKFIDLHRVIYDSSVGFLIGMEAEDAKRNYALTIAKGKEDDPYYVYIDIKPRLKRDEADFREARLVLNKNTYLPRQLWFRHPNGDETIWDIPKIETGVKLSDDEFKLVVPEGWKLNRLPGKTKEADSQRPKGY